MFLSKLRPQTFSISFETITLAEGKIHNPFILICYKDSFLDQTNIPREFEKVHENTYRLILKPNACAEEVKNFLQLLENLKDSKEIKREYENYLNDKSYRPRTRP